jgi:CubicO group peptidase (beta-lactamase class C family)
VSFERLARVALLAATTSAIVPGVAHVPRALATPRSAAPSPRPGETVQVGPATGPVSELPAARVELIELFVTNEMARRGIPGLSLAIAHEGALAFANGYGFADMENFVAAKADTVYRLASVSKAMTAVLTLQLAEAGSLELDDPIGPHCPAFPEKRWPVTSRQLLGHHGGIRHYRDGEVPMTRRYTTLEESLALFKDDPLEHEPGTRYLYTTYGYSLLGCVIEGVTERPFFEVLKESVLTPAGMTRTQPDDVRALIPNRTQGYVRDARGALLNAELADMSYKVPGGGLAGTAPDVARFGLALVSGVLLNAETLDAMLTPVAVYEEDSEGYGLGMSVGERNGRSEAWHTGGQEGASSALYFRPADGPVVAVLANQQGVELALLDLARHVADLVVADPEAAM